MGRSPGYGVWGSCVLNRVYNFTIKRLEQGIFLDWKPWTLHVGTNILFKSNSMMSFIYKKKLSEWEMKNKEDREKNADHK